MCLWQISDVLSDAGKPCGVESVCLYGGTSKGPQISSLKSGVVSHLIVLFSFSFSVVKFQLVGWHLTPTFYGKSQISFDFILYDLLKEMFSELLGHCHWDSWSFKGSD